MSEKAKGGGWVMIDVRQMSDEGMRERESEEERRNVEPMSGKGSKGED